MISVFIDTNILHCKNEQLDKAEYIEKLQEIIDDIEVNDIYTEVKILLPKMVINELFQQQLEAYESWRRQLERIRLPNMKYDKEFDYNSYLSAHFRDSLQKIQQGVVAVEVVDFPKAEKLNNIIIRAIKKEPPFEGKDKQSDKGFKDVVIWETIKEYKEKHINDVIVFYCNDNQLANNALKDEFYTEFRDEIYIEQKNKLMERLVRLCNKTEVVKTFSSQLMERIQKSMSHNNEILYALLMEDIIWGDGDKISGFEVVNVDITNCNDQKVQNMISYNVEIEIKMFYSTPKEREMYKLMGKREFDIYYDFETDKLLTKLYDSLTLGRCELSDFILLEN